MAPSARRLWRPCPPCGEGSALDAELLPGNLTGPHHVAQLSLPTRQCRGACLDLDEHDLAQLAVVETVEHQQVHGTAEKAGVFRIESELRQIRNELLVHLAGRDGLAALD